MKEKRHYHLFTVSHQGHHSEVVYRTDSMDFKLNDLLAVKGSGANNLALPSNICSITNYLYLGFMTEDEFDPSAPVEVVEDGVQV